MSRPDFLGSASPPVTAETILRDHLREMRKYANELETVLGADSPIVKRIRSCAYSNEVALNRITKPKCDSCGQPSPTEWR